MVRITSRRWYSADGQRSSRRVSQAQNRGSRRLISLCFLLALVVMLMQRVSDPRYVSQGFRLLGVPLEDSAANAEQQDVNQVASDDLASDADLWQATCNDLVPRFLGELPDTELQNFAFAWIAVSSPGDRLGFDMTYEGWRQLSERSESQLQEYRSLVAQQANSDPWGDQLVRFEQDWRSLLEQIRPPAEESSVEPRGIAESQGPPQVLEDASFHARAFRYAVNDYLATRVSRQMKDAAPWRKEEQDAFWWFLTLCRIQQPPTADLSPVVNTFLLESEDEKWKGRSVRFAGTVKRFKQVDRNHPQGSESGYWEMWLQGADGANQPVAVYTSGAQADALLSSRDSDANADGFDISISGLVGKRLAYASESGVQVAPVIFAWDLVLQQTEMVAVSPSTERVSVVPIWWILGLTAVVAILIPVFLQNRRAGGNKGRLQFRVGGHSRTRTTSASSGHRVDSGIKESAKMFLPVLFALVVEGHASQLAIAQTVAPTSALSAASMWLSAIPQVPPWATETQQRNQAEALVAEQLEGSLDAEFLANMLELQTPAASIPDGILKVIQGMERLRWDLGQDQLLQLPSAQLELKLKSYSGILRSAQEVTLNEAQLDWFAAGAKRPLHWLTLDVEAAEDAQPLRLSVLVLEVPETLQNQSVLLQPVSIDVVCVESAQAAVCLAERLRWVIPDSIDPNSLRPPIPERLVPLARSGWNLAWADLVEKHQQDSLQPQESEALLSLMRIAAQTKEPLLATDKQPSLTPTQAMGQPAISLGKPLDWQVRIVRGTRIPVDDPNLRQSLGGSSYVQFDGFVDLRGQRVSYIVSGEAIEFEGEYPITVVTKAAPSFPGPTDSRSWQVGEYAQVEGVFYRLWAYHSDRVSDANPNSRQAAPLVVGARLTPTQPSYQAARASEIGWFGYALCGATLLILALLLYSALAKDDPRLRRKHVAKGN